MDKVTKLNESSREKLVYERIKKRFNQKGKNRRF